MGSAEALGGPGKNIEDRAFAITQHVRVPEAQNLPAGSFDEGRSAEISFDLLGMVPTVELDC